MLNLNGKTVMITGANGGIGKCIARGFVNYNGNLIYVIMI